MFSFVSGSGRHVAMQESIRIDGKAVTVELSKGARQALSERRLPLLAQMELYFSCLIRKQVRFSDQRETVRGVPVNEKLSVEFRPVMTKKCGCASADAEPPLTDFPIAKTYPFIPDWLRIDYRGGQWQGEFGFTKLSG